MRNKDIFYKQFSHNGDLLQKFSTVRRITAGKMANYLPEKDVYAVFLAALRETAFRLIQQRFPGTAYACLNSFCGGDQDIGLSRFDLLDGSHVQGGKLRQLFLSDTACGSFPALICAKSTTVKIYALMCRGFEDCFKA